MPYTSQRIETLAELVELQPEWEALHANCTYSSLYNGFTYTLAAVETLLQPPAQIFFVTVRAQTPDHGLIAIFPFQLAPRERFDSTCRTLEYAALPEADKPYPIIGLGHEEGAWRALADFLRRHAGLWDVLELTEVRQGLEAERIVPRLFSSPRFQVRVTEGSRAPIVAIDEGWETFAAKHRKMRKSIRDIERAVPDLRFVVHDGTADWQDYFERFKALDQRSWKAGKVGISKNERSETFYRRLFERLSREGKIWFASFFDGDTMIAGSIAFSHGQTAYFCHVTYDEAYAKHSPGMVLTSLFLKHFQETPLKEADFLGGFAQYLDRWAKEIVTTAGITVYRLSPRILFDFVYFKGKTRVQGLARRVLHRSADHAS